MGHEFLTSFWAVVIFFGLALTFHETGHFVLAKLCRMRVWAYSIGIGPALVRFRRNETEYAIRLFPVAGYVRIAGMELGEEDVEDGFHQRPVPQRLLVILGGAAMNILLTVVLCFAVFAGWGEVVAEKNPTIASIEPNSPAAQSPLKPGDRLVEIAGIRVNSQDDVIQAIGKHPQEEIAIVVMRQGHQQTFRATPASVTADMDIGPPDAPYFRKGERMGRLGIGVRVDPVFQRVGPFTALWRAIEKTGQFIEMFVWVLGKLVTGQLSMKNLSGPVGIVHAVSQAAQSGWIQFLLLTAWLNSQIGLINLLPIPMLDGSRFVIYAVEGLRRKPFNRQKEAMFHLVGLGLLMILVVVVTFWDLRRLIGK